MSCKKLRARPSYAFGEGLRDPHSQRAGLTPLLLSLQMNDALHISDRVLVDRLISGDHEAADLFLTRFSRLVWAVLVRDFGLPRDRCEDLYQSLFLRLWEDDYRRLRNWSRQGDFASYLTTIVRHLALDLLRTRAPERENPLPDSDDHDHPCSAAPSQEELAALEEQRRIVERIVSRLSDREQILYRLRYVEELPYTEIAQELAATVNHVGVLLSRLTVRLRQEMVAVDSVRLPIPEEERTAGRATDVRSPSPGSSPDWN